jgi:hypothetical protein
VSNRDELTRFRTFHPRHRTGIYADDLECRARRCEAAERKLLFGSEPGGAANQDKLPSGCGLFEMRFHGRPILRREATDNFGNAAAQA